MAKFNLKKILITDYEVEITEATNFEQWVGRNLDFEAVMEKNFRDISFKSLSTNKKSFLKEVVYKSSKIEIPKSIQTIIDIIRNQPEENKNVELYDKIRKLELEIVEKNNIIDNQRKKINEISEPNLFKENILEAQGKIISEYNSYLRNFDLGFNMTEYEKAIGSLTFKRMENLKAILMEDGMDESRVDTLLNLWRERQQSAYNGEREVNVGFNKYHETREKLREQFNFIRKNSDFVDAVIFIKNMDVHIEKEENKKNEIAKDEQKKYTGPWLIKTNDLVNLEKSFISTSFGGGYLKNGWLHSAKVIFGTSRREVVFEKIGVNYKILTKGSSKLIEVHEPIESIVEKFNKKAIERLNEN